MLTRRAFLGAAAGGLTLAAGCTGTARRAVRPPRLVSPDGAAVRAVEAARIRAGGRVVTHDLRAQASAVDLGGTVVNTWTYNDTVPGPLLRANVGDVLAINLTNELPEHTTIHWHGLSLRNDMDGVHGVTQAPVHANGSFTYRFALDAPGTYWYHSHMGIQLDRGLYAPLIVDDPDDPGAFDVEHVLVLDDWVDGMGTTPDAVARLLHCKPRCADSPFIQPFRSEVLGGDAGLIAYPAHLINGRLAADRPTLTVPPGGKVKLRVINAGAETAYRFAVGGHRMTVTHSDGFPVEPVETDTLILGMGERYDVEFTVRDGAWPVVALAEGKAAIAAAVLRTTNTDARTTAAPPEETRPAELDGHRLEYSELRAVHAARQEFNRADRRFDISLTGRDSNYHWGIDGGAFPRNGSLDVREGDHARIHVRNLTKHWHPVHLHGHTFRLGAKADGPRKDTVIVRPGESFDFDVVCNNPGRWMLHCHNGYHFDAGMAIAFNYRE